QNYRDLEIAVFVPRFTKTFDVSAKSWGYSVASFTVADYKLYNAGGNVVAEAADTTIGFTIAEGTRYLLRFKIRVFNDTVEQSIGENTRCIVTVDGLRTVLRRMLHDNSPQDLGRPPMFIGVGGEGAYYIDNASDGRWRYDASATSYTPTTTTLFPTPSAAGDAFVFCREETDSDRIEGIEFDIAPGGAGVLATGASLKWQYWPSDGSDWIDLTGVIDDTNSLTVDGSVRWNIPMDADDDAELKAGTVGHYYRVLLVGDKFSTNPVLASKAEPLVYRTVGTETAPQQPYDRRLADVVTAPFTGNIAKASASFGLGSIPEEYDSDGLLIAKSYEPTREVGLFTTEALIEEENISITELSIAVVDEVMLIPTTNPEPIRILNIIDANEEIWPLSNYTLDEDEREVSGLNYAVTIPGVPDATYTITYLGKTIEPDTTPLNILSITGNIQSLFGPSEAYLMTSELN
ncbi:unnamed protein product, partial [marine sediment metagenome]